MTLTSPGFEFFKVDMQPIDTCEKVIFLIRETLYEYKKKND